MKRFAKQVLAIGFALGCLAATPRAARADISGYVCDTSDFWGSSPGGNNGYMYTNLSSGPNCTGTYIGSAYFTTPGQTVCPGGHPMTDSEKQTLSQKLALALSQGIKVSISGPTSNFLTCPWGMYLYAK
jgi:hypothetical protein